MGILRPRQPVPNLEIGMINGTRWRLRAENPASFTLLVFYRGLHCPICKDYLQGFDRLLDEFASRGVHGLSLTMDTRDRAQRAFDEWDLRRMPIGYGLSQEDARQWGLYLSRGIREGEPDLFCEPGLFLVRPDGTLYCAAVQTGPFARPPLAELLKAVDFIRENDYPARGEA